MSEKNEDILLDSNDDTIINDTPISEENQSDVEIKEEKSVEIKEEKSVDEKKLKFGKMKFILAIGLFFVFGVSGYTYYIGTTVSDKDEEIIATISNGYDEVSNDIGLELTSAKDEMNYKFFMESDYKLVVGDEEKINGFFNIKDGEILSKDGGLKQKIKLGEVHGDMNGSGVLYKEGSKIDIINFDLLSDNEKVYFFVEKGIDDLLANYDNNTFESENIDEYKTTFDAGKYVMIDNSKPLLKVFGELAKNELFKEFLIGSVTSDSSEYYKKNGIDIKLKKYLKSDKALDYLFKEGEKDELSGKVPLLLNGEICSDYAPVVVEALKNIGGANYTSQDVAPDELKTECEKQIAQINEMLPAITQIYKKGDIELGNFSLNIVQGDILDINIDYKDHQINTRYISLKDTKGQFALKINGDESDVISSLLKFNINENGIKINGEIIDGTGDINIEQESGNEDNEVTTPGSKIDIKGTITFLNYILTDYDISGEIEQMGMIGSLKAKGNILGGKITLDVSSEKEEIGNLLFEYDEKSYNLIFKSKDLNLESNYKEKVFIFNLKEILTGGGEGYLVSFSYDNGKVHGIIRDKKFENGEAHGIIRDKKFENGEAHGIIMDNMYEMVLEGFINEIDDIDLTFSYEDNKIILKAEGDINKSVIFSIDVDNDNSDLKGKIAVDKSEKNGYSMTDIKIDGELNKKGEKSIYNSNIKFGSKEGGVKFEIPTNVKEIDININEIVTIPDFTRVNTEMLNNKAYVIGGVTTFGVLGTVGFISLQGYSADARNTKRISDIGNIMSAITIKKVQGVPLEMFIIRDSKYEGNGLYIGGEKLSGGNNHKVGTPNYDVLGIKKEDFMDPDGSEYLIGITNKAGGKFEILGFMETDNGIKSAKVEGTYMPRSTTILKEGIDYKKDLKDKRKIVLEDKWAGFLKKGDILSGNKIKKVKSDGISISFEESIEKNKLLLRKESVGLIFLDGRVVNDGDLKR